MRNCECGGNFKKVSFSHEEYGLEFWNYVCENCGESKVTAMITMKFDDDYLDYLSAKYEED